MISIQAERLRKLQKSVPARYHLPVVAGLRAYIPRPTRMSPCTPKIDWERIIECSKYPQHPDNTALVTSLREKLHTCLHDIKEIEDITRLPLLVAEIAGDVFSRQEMPSK